MKSEYHERADRALHYLARKGALHKLSRPIPVIGRDIDITLAVVWRIPQPMNPRLKKV